MVKIPVAICAINMRFFQLTEWTSLQTPQNLHARFQHLLEQVDLYHRSTRSSDR